MTNESIGLKAFTEKIPVGSAQSLGLLIFLSSIFGASETSNVTLLSDGQSGNKGSIATKDAL